MTTYPLMHTSMSTSTLTPIYIQYTIHTQTTNITIKTHAHAHAHTLCVLSPPHIRTQHTQCAAHTLLTWATSHAEQQGHGQECLGGAKFDFGVGPLQAQSVSVWHYGRHPDG